MARENQGLQIALIVFVILTILFGVMTFVNYSSANKAALKAESHKKEAQKANNGLRERLKDVDELKKVIGFAETDDMDRIRDQSAADMNKYAATFPENTRNFRGTLEQMSIALREKNQLLDKALEDVNELNANNEARNRVAQSTIDTFKLNAQKAEEDKQGEIDKFNDDRQRMKSDGDKLAGDLQSVRKDKDTAVAVRQEKIAGLAKRLDETTQRADIAITKLKEVTNKDPKSFDGEIRWINQASKTVWINLGRADSLVSQTTFSVYPNDAGEITENVDKASIEITQILGNHLAEGRILSDSITDPIMPGDKINSPVWNPGEKQHFAITGVIELDNDGRDDTQRLYALIEMNGGVIDAKMDDKGKRHGKIGINTRYLVLGSEPEGKTVDMLEDWNTTQKRAEELGVETVSLQKLLDLMGWKKEADVLQYGSGAKGFGVHSERPPQVSPGKVSDLFKPRTPPRTNGGSAY